MFQDLSTRRHWPVKKATVDLPIRMKGNLKMHFRYFVELDGGPEQGSKRCFADLTKVKLSLRRRLVRSRSKWNLEVLVFGREEENWSTRRKTSRSKGENQQQTQPIYGIDSRTRTHVILLGGGCSHHCATLAPQ